MQFESGGIDVLVAVEGRAAFLKVGFNKIGRTYHQRFCEDMVRAGDQRHDYPLAVERQNSCRKAWVVVVRGARVSRGQTRKQNIMFNTMVGQCIDTAGAC